jgi:hypothetical protein
MAQWGNTDDAANSVLWAVSQLNKVANTTTQTNLYGNTTVGAFETNEINGQFGVDAVEAANTSSNFKKVAHAGWNLKTTGTGPLASVSIVAGGTGYSNGDVLTFAATGTGTVNATATVSTNSTGGITSLAITNPGAGFTNTLVYGTFANSTGGSTGGSTANVAGNIGGRAGRVSYETLVAMSTIT